MTVASLPSSFTVEPGAAPTIDAAIADTLSILDRLGIGMSRGSSNAMVRALSAIHHNLTLRPAIDPSRRAPVVVIKNLYTLWFFVLDDAIDRAGSLHELQDSAAIALGPGGEPRSPAGAIMAELLDRTRALGDDLLPLRVALGEVVVAHHYEYARRTRPALDEPERYLHHDLGITSFEPFLAIDALAARGRLRPQQLASASRTCRELSPALGHAFDIGSLARDRREGTGNIIELWRLTEPDAGDDELIARARTRIQRHLDNARSLAAAAGVPGLADVVEAAADMVTAHVELDLYGDGPDGLWQHGWFAG